jgi:osmotically-inducible protein OsmY
MSLIGVLLLSVAGLHGCGSVRGDPNARTPGVVFDDIAIQTLALRQIVRSDPAFRGANLTIASHNGHVLLAGQVANETLKQQAHDVVAGLDHVQSVHNVLTVEGSTSLLARTNDRWLTSKVKAKLLAERGIGTDGVKVITENGVVYLMGIVTRHQADEAVRVAGTIGGVQQIVKIFDYLD